MTSRRLQQGRVPVLPTISIALALPWRRISSRSTERRAALGDGRVLVIPALQVRSSLIFFFPGSLDVQDAILSITDIVLAACASAMKHRSSPPPHLWKRSGIRLRFYPRLPCSTFAHSGAHILRTFSRREPCVE
ncbi:hypothetical protein BV25DRAFT_1545086 [Artomyces pyxidatus]|uniref:Uncharacterized protein n=1 Tax=Artomyces pyxidatus TaxID=48021 RepID=A0ACB8SJM1_9AGAM|nr:hypothetical protein BV25DRAFT_1545086 [Artomyces pyxidatus]